MKILGFLDMTAASCLLVTAYNIDVPQGLIIAISVYLFLKGLLFFSDIGSMFDITAGILLILSLSMVLPQIVLFIFAGLLGLKGIMSLFA